jgi:hypothetical protein
MAERRGISQVLNRLTGNVEDDLASNAELRTKLNMTISKNRGFEKMRDQPLGEFLEIRKKRKQAAAIRKAGTDKKR